MITLRELVRSDRAIAAITSEECKLIATVLDWAEMASRRPVLKYFMPKELRQKSLSMRMLSATLNRAPEELAPGLNTQIQKAMEKDRNGDTVG